VFTCEVTHSIKLVGQNSQAFGVNVWGQAVGEAETSNSDPNEDFCGFAALGLPSPGGSSVPFLWQNGAMNPLPTLGGNNGAANTINNLGEVVGTAENNMPDGTCPSGGPQEYQFKPVVWRNRAVHELPTYPGDPDGFALGINEVGPVAGTSGDCAAFRKAERRKTAKILVRVRVGCFRFPHSLTPHVHAKCLAVLSH
jgi:uncharacterized membrane protein